MSLPAWARVPLPRPPPMTPSLGVSAARHTPTGQVSWEPSEQCATSACHYRLHAYPLLSTDLPLQDLCRKFHVPDMNPCSQLLLITSLLSLLVTRTVTKYCLLHKQRFSLSGASSMSVAGQDTSNGATSSACAVLHLCLSLTPACRVRVLKPHRKQHSSTIQLSRSKAGGGPEHRTHVPV